MFRFLVIVFPYFNAAATTAFVDPFRAADYLSGETHFHWEFASVDGGGVRASNGMDLFTQSLAKVQNESWDLVVVSCSWTPEKFHSPRLQGLLRGWASKGCMLGAIDTGTFLLAEAGLLSGRRATGHYEHIDALIELYGPYVADYSRYLPADVRTKDTFWTTYFGCALGSLGMMALGATLAAVVPSALNVDPGTAIANLFGPWAKAALLVVALGVIQYNVLCLYSAYMSTTTIFSGFAKLQHVRHGTKTLLMAVLSVLACVIAIQTQYHFDTFFADILIGQLYLLIPWSAINLVDYYVVQRGSYSIDDLYDAQGRYGRWNRKTMIVYGVSIIGTVPFMKLSFFEGYFAKLIGADVSWIAGLVLAGFLYCIFNWNRASSATTQRARDRQGVSAFANAEE